MHYPPPLLKYHRDLSLLAMTPEPLPIHSMDTESTVSSSHVAQRCGTSEP